MNLRTTRFALIAAGLALSAGAVAVIAWAAGPLDADDPVGPARPAVSAAALALPTLASFEPLWNRDLRALHPPSAAAAPVAQAAGLGVRLLGTILEPGHSLAIFQTPAESGSARAGSVLRGVGDEIGGARIVSIDADAVTLDAGAGPVTLAVEKPTEVESAGAGSAQVNGGESTAEGGAMAPTAVQDASAPANQGAGASANPGVDAIANQGAGKSAPTVDSPASDHPPLVDPDDDKESN